LSFIRFIKAQELTVSNVDQMDTPSFFMRQSEKETLSTYFHKFVSGVDETSDPWYKTSSNAKLYQFSNQPVKTNRVKGLQKVQEPKSEAFIR
ncbi:unnamed protein product, partial [Porites lobata]